MPIPILPWPFDVLLLLLYQFVISVDQFNTKRAVGKEGRRDLHAKEQVHQLNEHIHTYTN